MCSWLDERFQSLEGLLSQNNFYWSLSFITNLKEQANWTTTGNIQRDVNCFWAIITHEEQVKESTLEDLQNKEAMVKESSSNMVGEDEAAGNPESEQQNL